MSVVVQKFGGSSVSTVEKIRWVAERVKQRRASGDQVVVVVSAMGDTTDELLSLAKRVAADPPRRELDMLLTCGERISMALLSMALQDLEVPAVSFTGSQSGLITDEAHAQARIVEVKPLRIQEALETGKVVIVAGYQGVSRAREVTTLGRGGSDTTAVALAAALGGDCEIYSDVDGIFSADPRVVPEAVKLAELSYDEMQALAAAGARVLNAQAVEFAKEKGIVIHARSAHGSGTGTPIRPLMPSTGVKAVASETELLVVFSPGSFLRALLERLDAKAIRGRTLTWEDGGRAVVLVPTQDVHAPTTLVEELKAEVDPSLEVREDLGTVTLVGSGLTSSWDVVRRALDEASTVVAPVAFELSHLQLNLVVPRSAVHALTVRLHQEFVR